MICAMCPLTFEPRSRNQRFCSSLCRREAWMANNREPYLAQKRKRSRIVTETRKESVKRYNLSHKEKRRISTQKWRSANRLRGRAHVLLHKAVKLGRVVKLPCWCGDAKSQGHHDYYSKPLEVKWLCQKHHKELHRQYA